jgi:hypothetical protein
MERFEKPFRHRDVPPHWSRKRSMRQTWRGFAATVCLQTAAGCPVLQTIYNNSKRHSRKQKSASCGSGIKGETWRTTTSVKTAMAS